MDKHAMKVVKGNETVSQLPREFSWIVWYFLACSGEISVEGIGPLRATESNDQQWVSWLCLTFI